jgi:hypothetical protein
MELAELPRPQSAWLAMWPPQARTIAAFVPIAVGTLNSTLTVVLHWPCPDFTFWAV